MKADPREVITVDLPEWRIVDDAIWFAVQERFNSREPTVRKGRPAAKYALTSIAKCGACGGAIGATRVRAFGGGEQRALSYGCAKHHERGNAVCSVTVHQPMPEVEGALIDHLQKYVLSDGVLQLVLDEIRNEIATQLPEREADVSVLEAELKTARLEQKRLARAIALADDVPELVSELRQRSNRIVQLEAQILSAKRTPAELVALSRKIEASARAKLEDLRNALAE